MTERLGTWPQDRYYLSWVTQRLANRAPEQSHARRSPGSVFKQVSNPLAQSIEETIERLIKERNNSIVSTCDIFLLDHLYRVNLYPTLSYKTTVGPDNNILYSTPTVYATINETEYEITQSYNNSVDELYNAIPSRLEDGETSYLYNPIIDSIQISELVSTTPADPIIPGHLYITITGNTNWESRIGNNIYYSKVYIKGTTRKETYQTEVIPIRYNGTFKTINQWKEIEEIFVSYMDSDAYISVDCFPWFSDGILDNLNLNIDKNGDEKFRFLNIKERNFGYTFVSESFTTSDFDGIRKGIDEKDIEHEIELLTTSGQNISINAFTNKPGTDYIFCVDDSKFYVYNTKLEYPNVKLLKDESPDVKMDLYTEKWIVYRGETAVIKTRLLNFSSVPFKIRWYIENENGSKYTLTSDGTIIEFTDGVWEDNDLYEEGRWLERVVEFQIQNRGTSIVTIECAYYDDETGESEILSTKHLFYAPYIYPEIELNIPETIFSIDDMSFDSDGRLWAQSGSYIKLLNLYYDYFIADYSRNILFLKEQYSSVRVVV